MLNQTGYNDVMSRAGRATAIAGEQRKFVRRVYNWMMAGLALTGVVAFIIASNPALVQIIFSSKLVLFGIIAAQLGLVIWLSGWVERMSLMTAMTAFMGYAGLTGVTFASVFIVYTASSITTAFAVTALTFGAMSVYGYVTDRDLTSLGSFLFMGLVGIVIASLVNIWLQNAAVTWFVTYAGVLIFTGLTAYDTQRIKRMSQEMDGSEMGAKMAICGALALYLDFINLFLMLLQIMGDRR